MQKGTKMTPVQTERIRRGRLIYGLSVLERKMHEQVAQIEESERRIAELEAAEASE